MRTSATPGREPSAPPAAVAVDAVREQEDEGALWSRWRERSDPAARLLLIERFRPFARTIAAAVYRRRARSDVEFEDYHQFALLGLIEAVERYDPARLAQFRTFAGPRIRGAILNGLERMTERLDIAAKRRQLERERISSALPALRPLEGEALLQQLGDIGVNVAVTFILDGIGLGEEARDAGREDPYRQVELRELGRQLGAMVARLPPRERAVLDMHYREGRTFEEIAAALDVSRPRASQLHRRAIERLRALISKAEGCDTAL